MAQRHLKTRFWYVPYTRSFGLLTRIVDGGRIRFQQAVGISAN